MVKAVMDGVTTLYVSPVYQVKGSVVTKYYVAGDQVVACRTGSTLSYLLSDHIGSNSITVSDTGIKTAETRYKAWGEVRYQSGTNPSDRTYTGQRSYTSDFGLMYYNARWYDSSLGRFGQADTVVPEGIQGYDRYAYGNNNPVKYSDPSGHCVVNGKTYNDADPICSRPPEKTPPPPPANGGTPKVEHCNSSGAPNITTTCSWSNATLPDADTLSFLHLLDSLGHLSAPNEGGVIPWIAGLFDLPLSGTTGGAQLIMNHFSSEYDTKTQADVANYKNTEFALAKEHKAAETTTISYQHDQYEGARSGMERSGNLNICATNCYTIQVSGLDAGAVKDWMIGNMP